MCQNLSDQDAKEHRVEELKPNCLLRKAKTPKSNITQEERKVLKELSVVGEKGLCGQVDSLLAQLAYGTIIADLASNLKTKLMLTLKRIKNETNMGEGMYRTITLLAILLWSSMDYQKSIKLVPPWANGLY